MNTYRIFYAGLLYCECTDQEIRLIRTNMPPEIYNGGYMFVTQTHPPGFAGPWYRIDGTPVLLEDVPKTYLTLNLLLG